MMPKSALICSLWIPVELYGPPRTTEFERMAHQIAARSDGRRPSVSGADHSGDDAARAAMTVFTTHDPA